MARCHEQVHAYMCRTHDVACARSLHTRILLLPSCAMPEGDINIDPLVARTRISSRPTHGPVCICIRKFTNCAGDLLPQYLEKNVGLYQIQLEHEVAPNSVTFQIKTRLAAFLQGQAKNDETLPTNLEDITVACTCVKYCA